MTDTFDDEPMPAQDARLLERLGAALGPDPLPEGLHRRLDGLLALRDLDRELLELLQGAAPELAGMRGPVDLPGRLAFELGNGSVSVELTIERDQLHGQVLAGNVVEVTLDRLGGQSRIAAVQALGRFSFEDLAPGPARLRLRGGETRSLTTDWFLL